MKSGKIIVLVLSFCIFSPVLQANEYSKDTACVKKWYKQILKLYRTEQINKVPIYLDSVKLLYEKHKSDYLKARYYQLKASYFMNTGQKDSSLIWHERTWKAVVKLQNQELIRYTMRGLIRIYSENYTKEESMNKIDSLVTELKVFDSGSLQASAYTFAEINFTHHGRFKEANRYGNEAIRISRELKDSTVLIWALHYKATLFMYLAQYEEALKLYLEELQIAEATDNMQAQYAALHQIGNLYNLIGELDKSLEFYSQLISILPPNETEDNFLSTAYNNIGDIYMQKQQTDSALYYIEKSMDINVAQNFDYGLFFNTITLAEIYLGVDDYEKAHQHANDAMELARKVQSVSSEVYTANRQAEIYMGQQNYKSAEEKLQFAYEKMKNTSDLPTQVSVMRNMAKLYEKKGDYVKAYQYYKTYTALNDSMATNENATKINSLMTSLEIKKFEQENKLLRQEKLLDKATIEKQNMFRNLLLVLLLSVAIVITVLFFAFTQKKKANTLLRSQKKEIQAKNKLLEAQKEEIVSQNETLQLQNEEISAQRDEIMAQRDELEKQRNVVVEQNKEITDSIAYAQRIQKAVLPRNTILEENFAQHFILWKPRDIVSGDFYWIEENADSCIVIASDCTGHGVPGAFMSMLGMAYLNEIIRKKNIRQPKEILENMRREIKNALKQANTETRQKDGMDIAIAYIDKKTKIMQFAGAYNPAYVIRKEQNTPVLTEIKADKQPVGIYFKEEPFTQQSYQLKKHDRIYLFSDGYYDQFGGAMGGKYMKKNFKKLLLRIQDEELPQQKIALENELHDWMRSENEQLDDILVLSVEIG